MRQTFCRIFRRNTEHASGSPFQKTCHLPRCSGLAFLLSLPSECGCRQGIYWDLYCNLLKTINPVLGASRPPSFILRGRICIAIWCPPYQTWDPTALSAQIVVPDPHPALYLAPDPTGPYLVVGALIMTLSPPTSLITRPSSSPSCGMIISFNSDSESTFFLPISDRNYSSNIGSKSVPVLTLK